MRDEFDEPQPTIDARAADVAGAAAEVTDTSAAMPHVPAAPKGIELLNRDFLTDAANLPDGSIDLILADPPYGLGKDYGNDSDMRSGEDFLAWTREWLDLAIPKLKPSGSLYIFCTWQYAPEIFVFLKSRLTMVNEIVWDRRVPSMGGTTRRFTSVHDNIGFFAVAKAYYFDLDPVRIPYDADTKNRRWNAWGYIDARDGSQAILKSLESHARGFDVFIIAAADTVSDRPNAELAAAEFADVPVARDLGEHDTLLSIDKARRLLGYDPQHSWRDHA